MISIWKYISILIPVFVLFFMAMCYSTPESDMGREEQMYMIYQQVQDLITPEDPILKEYSRSVLGGNYDENLTISDITLFRNSIVNNFVTCSCGETPPNYIITNKKGTSLGLSILEYSLILSENSSADSFLIYAEAREKDSAIYEIKHSTLTFFDDYVYLSDISLHSACKPNRVDLVIDDLVKSSGMVDFNVKYAISNNERAYFSNYNEFLDWMLYKMGYVI